MSEKEKAFMGERQVLLVGLGGVGGKIVDTIMRDLPQERKPYTQAIAIDTDMSDMNDLENVPRKNKIVLAASASNGKSMTIGSYLEKNPSASEWFVTEGAAFKTLARSSTKDGAKQIRMVSRLALSATAKYYNFEDRIVKVINELSASDGATNRDGLLIMVVCSVSGGTGAGTVLQVPMFLEDIITRYYDASEVSMQCAMLLPNLFNSTQAMGNLEKGRVNGYAVMRELQSLNTGKLKRFEYMQDYVEVDGEDTRNKTPFSYVVLFDNATSSGGTVNGSTDNVHIPNIAKCLYEYVFGPAAHKCKSQLDNTLDTIYSSGGTAIFRAIGRASLQYPDNIYKQYAVSKWILRAISDDWILPGEIAKKNYLEERKKARNDGLKLPENTRKHDLYVQAIMDEQRCKGTFYTDIRHQLVTRGNQKTILLADLFYDKVKEAAKVKMNNPKNNYAKSFSNLSDGLKAKSDDTHDISFDKVEQGFREFMSGNGNFVDSVMCPSDSLTAKFLNKQKDGLHFYTFIKEHKLHPVALRTFLYQLEKMLIRDEMAEVENYTQTEVLSVMKNVKKKDKQGKVEAVKSQMELYAKPFEQKLIKDIATRMKHYVDELIIEVESFFEDLVAIGNEFDGIASSCFKNLELVENEMNELVGSKEGMIACWNDIKETLTEGDFSDEDVIDNALSEEINKMIYQAYFKWVSSDNAAQSSNDEDGFNVFRPKTDYKEIVSDHLLKNFNKRVDGQHSKSFPKDIIDAVIFDTYARKAYQNQVNNNPQFNPEKFNYSPSKARADYEADGKENSAAADYLKQKLVALVKKAEPLCGPLYSKEANQDYLARVLYFNQDILEVVTTADPNNASSIKRVIDKSKFIPGVDTDAVDNYTIQIEPVKGIDKYQIGCFSYTGGLELHDFANMQDPVCGTYNDKDGRCYYNAYRRYINNVMNTTKENVSPHLNKKWHLAGMLNDVTDAHTDSVNYHSAKAFVYGFLFNDVIRIIENGYVKIGIRNNTVFSDMPGSLNGIIDFSPMTEVEHARFNSTKESTNRILYEIFQYLRNMPELRTRLIKYGDELLEKAKANKSPSVFGYSVEPEMCADQEYKTIIDVIDGFYQYARTSDLHDDMKSDVKALSNMFDVLCDATIDVCASIYSSSKDRLEAYSYFVNRLYTDAICDDGQKATTSDCSKFEEMFSKATINSESLSATKPFSNSGDLSKEAMMSRMESYLNQG